MSGAELFKAAPSFIPFKFPGGRGAGFNSFRGKGPIYLGFIWETNRQVALGNEPGRERQRRRDSREREETSGETKNPVARP